MTQSNTNKKLRETRQRNAIKRVLAETSRPLSPKEILDAAAKDVPNLGVATIYRNIRILVDQGVLKQVDLPGQPARYQLSAQLPSLLFLDESTNAVFSFDHDLSHLQLNLPGDFQTARIQIFCYGRRAS